MFKQDTKMFSKKIHDVYDCKLISLSYYCKTRFSILLSMKKLMLAFICRSKICIPTSKFNLEEYGHI